MLEALRGVRVLDLTHMLAGPYGSLLLADLGAEVVKVERPGKGDEIRAVGPHFLQGESVYFLSVNRGKKSVCLDLGHPRGRAVLRDLAARADVVLENFRFGVAERLGCDHETLQAVNPRLVVCGITAFGRTGPDRALPAFDLTLQARGGVLGLTGVPGERPVRCGVPLGDLAGGLFAALAIASALYQRERTGRGSFIDLGLLDCQVSLLTYALAGCAMTGDPQGPQGTGHGHAIPYQTFDTADGSLAVAVFTDAFWPGFCRALERPEWALDPALATDAARRADRQAVLVRVAGRLREAPTSRWLPALYREGVPAAPVQSLPEVLKDPQVLARAMLAVTEHPVAGTVVSPGNPMKLGPWQGETHAPAPRLGEHTDQVLRDLLGYPPDTLAGLREDGVIA